MEEIAVSDRAAARAEPEEGGPEKVILVGTDPEGVRIAMDRIIRGYYKMTGSGSFTPVWTMADT